MHKTQGVPVMDNGDGTLDFAGRGMTWNSIPDIKLGGDPANFAADTGLTTIMCPGGSCVAGGPFCLDYAAHVPLGHP